MDRRTFLQISSALSAGPLLSPLSRRVPDQQPITNWAGNLTYGTTNIEYPASVDAIQELVKKYDKVKVLGTRHCFNTIADSKDRFISLRNINKIISLDEKAKTVTMEAGIKYGELAPWLNEKGYALHNLATLPHVSVAGAIT
ncbi:MAG TPA: FAD-binding protein, partial [Chitinophagaceae bacterium]|nr:FAD-binding protein [Chitinophagaceae bacterium]